MSKVSYFLAANAPEGFVSHHEDWLAGWDTVYLIKGGPGGGKSTYMRRIQRRMERCGLPCEEVLCATDPDSLDGLGIPALGTAFFDATPPHAAEPRYFGAKDVYLPLGGYCDAASLKGKTNAIKELTDGYKAAFPRITRCLAAAKEVSDQRFDAILRGVSLDRLNAAAAGLIAQEGLSVPGGNGGRVHARFLSARDGGGIRFLEDTVRALCPRRHVIEDTYGLSPFVLAPILRAATAAGHCVWVCHDPLSPRCMLRHVLLPDLGLGFVTGAGGAPPAVRTGDFIDPAVLNGKRLHLTLLSRIEETLCEEASLLMKEARGIHDELEALYLPYIDFDGLTASADALAERLLDVAL